MKFHFLRRIPFSNGDSIFTVVFSVIAEKFGTLLAAMVMSVKWKQNVLWTLKCNQRSIDEADISTRYG